MILSLFEIFIHPSHRLNILIIFSESFRINLRYCLFTVMLEAYPQNICLPDFLCWLCVATANNHMNNFWSYIAYNCF